MKPINIYALTRLTDMMRLERLERHMSGRISFLKIKPWEIEGLRRFCEYMDAVLDNATELEFYYSFTMPKLGKEFDLLRISEDTVVNIELKSGDVSDDVIRKQLVQNRYYLATLHKNMYFYTYISRSDRLVRLSNSGKLVDAMWEELAVLLERQKDCYDGNVEELFKEDRYLISPLTDPGRFLRREYFLTSQQRDIEKKILKNIRNYTSTGSGNHGTAIVRHNDISNDRKTDIGINDSTDNNIYDKSVSVQGFTGLPGTGKTILLYDIAMQLSWSKNVCVLHFGSYEKELDLINDRLKRIDFYYCDAGNKISVDNRYSAILVDEGHRLDKNRLSEIIELASEWNAPVVISYDKEDAIASDERKACGAELIESLPGYVRYQLTNRIRMNSELSSFIGCLMYSRRGNHRREYPSVSIAYASDETETVRLVSNYIKKGYVYICDPVLDHNFSVNKAMKSYNMQSIGELSEAKQQEDIDSYMIESSDAACKEFDNVVMIMDDSFTYDESGYLRYNGNVNSENVDAPNDQRVRNLFHGLSRAKMSIAIVVMDNVRVFDLLLYILQSN